MSAPPAAVLSFRALHAPKEGNSEEEYEDAYAPATGPEPDVPTWTVAVSDGASSSVFARQWARLLVEAFGSAPGEAAEARDRIARLGRRWREQVSSAALPWYAQEKLTHGSHASLLVVTWDLRAGVWSARAIGDTCLFVLRQDRLIHAFPVSRSTAFDNRPPLVSTEAGAAAGRLPDLSQSEGRFQDRDRFLLMTDALAAWFLAEAEAGRRPWDALPADDAALAGWLRERRDGGAMRNDDVTLVEVIITEPEAKEAR